MSDRDRQFSLVWLEKAHHDLYAMDKLSDDPGSPSDIIAFHCQQAIEKSIKGLLTAHSRIFPRTHDLVELIDLSLPDFPSLTYWREQCKRISRYAVEIRYPDSGWEPLTEELLLSLKAAREIYRSIQSHIEGIV